MESLGVDRTATVSHNDVLQIHGIDVSQGHGALEALRCAQIPEQNAQLPAQSPVAVRGRVSRTEPRYRRLYPDSIINRKGLILSYIAFAGYLIVGPFIWPQLVTLSLWLVAITVFLTITPKTK